MGFSSIFVHRGECVVVSSQDSSAAVLAMFCRSSACRRARITDPLLPPVLPEAVRRDLSLLHVEVT